jgi:hypothetical protein
MWLGLLLACFSPSATSCNIMAKTDQLFYSEQECKAEGTEVANNLLNQNVYAIPMCVKIGENA